MGAHDAYVERIASMHLARTAGQVSLLLHLIGAILACVRIKINSRFYKSAVPRRAHNTTIFGDGAFVDAVAKLLQVIIISVFVGTLKTMSSLSSLWGLMRIKQR